MDLLDRPLAELPLVFFDVETTGLSFRKGDRICEVAALRCEPSGKEDLCESLINPGCPVSPRAFQVHKISPQMLAPAPHFAEVVPRLKEVFRGAIGVAHNARFDIGFLRSEFLRLGQPFLLPCCLDTLAFARAFYRFPRNNLQEIARSLGIQVHQAHRARADVETLRAIFRRMVRDMEEHGLKTPRQMKNALRRLSRKRSASPLFPLPLPTSLPTQER